MQKLLIIANYRRSVGGIAGQVDVLLDKLNNEHFFSKLFNTKTGYLKRLLLPFKLFYKSNNFDIFHIHGCSGFGFYPVVIGVVVGVLRKKKIIITYHGGDLKEFIDSYPKFIKYFLKKADILTVPSFYLQDILKINKIDSIYLPNIIREDNVNFKVRKKFCPTLVVTRSLEKVYNIPLEKNAFYRIKSKMSEAKLYIVGDGSLKNELETKVKNSGVDGIYFLGRVDNSKIGEIINKSDIYINPTTADNMPLSLFEAFACGIPVISTNVGGIPNFIQNNKSGFLINSNDLEALVEKIEFILANPNKIIPIIEAAHVTFQKYTWNRLKSQYIELYALLIK